MQGPERKVLCMAEQGCKGSSFSALSQPDPPATPAGQVPAASCPVLSISWVSVPGEGLAAITCHPRAHILCGFATLYYAGLGSQSMGSRLSAKSTACTLWDSTVTWRFSGCSHGCTGWRRSNDLRSCSTGRKPLNPIMECTRGPCCSPPNRERMESDPRQ